jgi:hypothetical protein
MNDDLLTQDAWTFAFLIAAVELTVVVFVGYLRLTILFFRKRDAAVGLLCSLLLLLPGCGWLLGVFVGLLFGWTRARRWGVESFMAFWSAVVLLAVVNYALFLVMGPMPVDRWQHYFGWLPRVE